MEHKRNPQSPSPEIVELKGCRLVYANETEEGQRLSCARIKDLTGGDSLTGRVPYGKASVTFSPTHKLTIVGNYKPEISDNSAGMWGRVGLVPFDVTIPKKEQDRKLLEKLKAEGAGILNWALDGLRAWQKNGLQIPKKVNAATHTYRDDQDILGEWICECCTIGPECSEVKRDLYINYQEWTKQSGHKALSATSLTKRLKSRGVKFETDKRTVRGLALKRGIPDCGVL